MIFYFNMCWLASYYPYKAYSLITKSSCYQNVVIHGTNKDVLIDAQICHTKTLLIN